MVCATASGTIFIMNNNNNNVDKFSIITTFQYQSAQFIMFVIFMCTFYSDSSYLDEMGLLHAFQ